MFTAPRSLLTLTCLTLIGGSIHATDFTWIGGNTSPNDMLLPANWQGGIVPPNNGTDINFGATDKLLFGATVDALIPAAKDATTSNGAINFPAGSQFLVNTAGNKRVEPRTNMQGTGPDGNGALFVASGGWGQPQNLFLTGAMTVTATGQRFRIDGGPNRLDLQGNALTVQGTGETNLVNTNAYNTTGTINANQIFSVEGNTRIDPRVVVNMGANTLYTSWDGNNNRRESIMNLGNNAAIETRKVDNDLTFTGATTVAAGSTAILRPQIQAVTQPGDGQDMRLNMMSPIGGAGSIRQDGNGTLMLSGNNTHTGGTTLNGAATSTTLAASNTAFGTGAVTVATASTVNVSNAGGLEFRDALQRDEALPAPTAANVINPALTGLHSVQPYDNTRFSYTGKINNTSASAVVYSFVEQYDDDVFVQVDGTTVINDNQWNIATNGQISLTPGEHDIRLSVRNGGGGAGPNNGFEAFNFAYGIGMTTALPLGGATTAPADYTGVGKALQVYQAVDRTIANPFILNAALTLTSTQMNGRVATMSGPISGPSGLTAGGSTAFSTDQLILSGTNTYAGDTTVTNGANLRVTGTHTNAANYVVNTGGVLFVNGTLAVTDNATPNAPADLSITNNGAASFGASAILRLELFSDAAGANGAASENDELLVGGPISLTLAGTLTVGNPNNIATFSTGEVWDLFDWNTAPTGTFNTVNLPTLPGGLAWNTSDLYSGGTIQVVVPEPTTAALLALLGGVTLLRRRRN